MRARASAKMFACHGESDDPANRGSTNSFNPFSPSNPAPADAPSSEGTATAKYGIPSGFFGSIFAGVVCASVEGDGRSSIPRKTSVGAEVGRRADWNVLVSGSALGVGLVVGVSRIRFYDRFGGTTCQGEKKRKDSPERSVPDVLANLLKLCKIQPFILDILLPAILCARRRLLGDLQ